jgi:hypothetical protein
VREQPVRQPASDDCAEAAERQRRLPKHRTAYADEADDPERNGQSAEEHDLTETVGYADAGDGAEIAPQPAFALLQRMQKRQPQIDDLQKRKQDQQRTEEPDILQVLVHRRLPWKVVAEALRKLDRRSIAQSRGPCNDLEGS